VRDFLFRKWVGRLGFGGALRDGASIHPSVDAAVDGDGDETREGRAVTSLFAGADPSGGLAESPVGDELLRRRVRAKNRSLVRLVLEDDVGLALISSPKPIQPSPSSSGDGLERRDSWSPPSSDTDNLGFRKLRSCSVGVEVAV